MVSWEQLVHSTEHSGSTPTHTRFYNVFPLTDNSIDKNHTGPIPLRRRSEIKVDLSINAYHHSKTTFFEAAAQWTDLFWWMTENSSALIARKKTIGRCGGFSSRAAAIKTLRFSVDFGHEEWATWAAAWFLIYATILNLLYVYRFSFNCIKDSVKSCQVLIKFAKNTWKKKSIKYLP